MTRFFARSGQADAFGTAFAGDVVRRYRKGTGVIAFVECDGTARQHLQPTKARDTFEQQTEQQRYCKINAVPGKSKDLCDPRCDWINSGLVLACE
ncbi:hypothetical protein WS58_16450 [Burkholderia pseudomultivorans]|nr:hypothetical protein WS57_34745 [Burkholderia pseudomultivorans]KVC27758.1 hypothetical protein WS55_12820 [Burkholderia pseudomultivorans]KVC36880.1 hypothetical protein WS56_00190 [Burkholderia pseudomultivorans]KVC42121.1 hypothetical protein WS58_16450 [Burkholderia pseudomultivorans]